MATQSKPSAGSLITVTNKGEVTIFDPLAMERSGLDASEKRTQDDSIFSQAINVTSRPLPIVHSLENGFGVDSSLFLQVKLHEDAARFALNLQTGRAVPEADIALHFNPRLDQNKVVLNDRKAGTWGVEETQPLIIMQGSSASKVFHPGHSVQIVIKSESSHLNVSKITDNYFCLFAAHHEKHAVTATKWHK